MQLRTCLAALAVVLGATRYAEAAKPNVLFLFTDDQRADTIAALGNPAIKTPNLDKLVERGFAFTNNYCLGANMGAVCRPSRNMLLSGRAYFRWLGEMNAPADKPNFPDSMKAVGYETFHEGKRGNTAQLIHKRFDHSSYLNDEEVRLSGEHGKQIIDDAIAFLDKRQADKPFFMYLAFAGPHDPRVADAKYMNLYDRSQIPLPKNYLPVHPFDNGWMTGRDEQLEAWPRTEDAVRRHLHDYYACITSIDGHIGRLMQTLKDLGQLENTIVIFSSDNGLAIGSHGLFGKQNVYEVGMKVPLVLAGPGIPQGRSDALTYLYDIYPTVCELVGAPVPDGLDGKSFAPVLRGEKPAIRDSLFLAYEDVQRAVRDEQWKLIIYPQINRSQLFDLQQDPQEMHDLIGDPQHAERIEALITEMRRWQQELGDDQPLAVVNPKDATFTPPAPGELAPTKPAQKTKKKAAKKG
ncbi:MAG: sulfatase-like hydrolase/transferase [Planctomycetota bacterium]